MFRAVVFDLDGTLHDYETAAAEAMEKVYSIITNKYNIGLSIVRERYQKILEDARAQGFHHGKPGREYRKERFMRLLNDLSVFDQAGNLVELILAVYENELNQKMTPFPAARKTLEQLGNKYKLYLATAGPSDTQRQKLKVLGLERYFERIFITGELKKRKTNGELFQHIIEELGHKAEEIIVVGDSYDMDILGSYKAGLKAVWLRRTAEKNRTKEQNYENIPFATIQNIEDLLQIL